MTTIAVARRLREAPPLSRKAEEQLSSCAQVASERTELRDEEEKEKEEARASVGDDQLEDAAYLSRHGVGPLLNVAVSLVLDALPRDPLAALERHLRALAPTSAGEASSRPVSRCVATDRARVSRGTASSGAAGEGEGEGEDARRDAARSVQCAVRRRLAKESVVALLQRRCRVAVGGSSAAAGASAPPTELLAASVRLQCALRAALARGDVEWRRLSCAASGVGEAQ